MSLRVVETPKDVESVVRRRMRGWLIFLAGLGPAAFFLAEKFGHLFGICLGAH